MHTVDLIGLKVVFRGHCARGKAHAFADVIHEVDYRSHGLVTSTLRFYSRNDY